MFDIHNHYLAGVDDGPDTLEQSLVLARIAANQGITHVLCTPHFHIGRYDWDAKNLEAKFSELKTSLATENIQLQLALSAEVHLTDEILSLVKKGGIPFCGIWQDKQAILLELPHSHIPIGVDKLIKWLLKEGIQPIIAHPERNKGVMRNFRDAELIRNAGAIFQVTSGSVAGHFGEFAQQSAFSMLDRHWVEFMASDAHNPKRPPAMEDGVNALKEYALLKGKDQQYGEDLAHRLVLENPQILTKTLFAQKP